MLREWWRIFLLIGLSSPLVSAVCKEDRFKRQRALNQQDSSKPQLAVDRNPDTRYSSKNFEEAGEDPWFHAELEEQDYNMCKRNIIGVKIWTKKDEASQLKNLEVFVGKKTLYPHEPTAGDHFRGTFCGKSSSPATVHNDHAEIDICCRHPMEGPFVLVHKWLDKSDKSDRLVISELEVIFEMDHECHQRKEEEDPAKDDHKHDGKGRFLAGVFFTPEQLDRIGKRYANSPVPPWTNRPARATPGQVISWELWTFIMSVEMIVLAACFAAQVWMDIEEERIRRMRIRRMRME